MQLSARAWLASALTGFASLGVETLWIRLAGFANGNTPQTFGLVLGVFLLGIALGALAGKRGKRGQTRYSARPRLKSPG